MEREFAREARLENLEALRDFVVDSCHECQADPATCDALELAVDEVCANLVMHGYAGLEPGPIRLTFNCDDRMAEVTIVDFGHAFSPDAIPKPDLEAHWSDRRVGGLGWHIIRKAVDEIVYQADGAAGNRLTLRKRLHPNGG